MYVATFSFTRQMHNSPAFGTTDLAQTWYLQAEGGDEGWEGGK